jgi:hypothetical protein
VTATSANLFALQLELQQDFTKITVSAHLTLSVFPNSVMSRIINAPLNVLPYHLDIWQMDAVAPKMPIAYQASAQQVPANLVATQTKIMVPTQLTASVLQMMNALPVSVLIMLAPSPAQWIQCPSMMAVLAVMEAHVLQVTANQDSVFQTAPIYNNKNMGSTLMAVSAPHPENASVQDAQTMCVHPHVTMKELDSTKMGVVVLLIQNALQDSAQKKRFVLLLVPSLNL